MHYRILVVAPAWVGDSVMAQPLYQRIKQYRPDAHLTVMAPDWTLPLLERMPEVDATLRNPFGHGALKLGKRWQLGRSLKRKFDQAILLPNSIKSALVPWFARVPIRTGFVGESRYGLLNDIRTLDPKALPMMVERFAILAEPGGKPLPRPVPAPHLTIRPESQQAALKALGLDLDRPVVAFCPGAEFGPAKRWPARHFAELARRLSSQGYAIWLFGSSKDRGETEAIARMAGVPLVDLAGRTTLAQAIDLLSLAHLVVTNDSGLMHVAAALERPLVALYGSSSPEFTPPLNERAEVVTLDLECSPCFERNCPLKHFDCMEKLGCDQVEAAIARTLTKPPGTPASPYIPVAAV
ncbi:lipopolysaccharide heptosyltransferase II [Chitinimonas sp. BJYL2]|uniref:lipopolysaccharide heptosyltransferase II n=1 Tax=Chitinimonas sp. BJYL2 TaxID=2976696 RepID=UPI0022B31F46|nr:lipopolysaccharide heptosyltransferase II [Chitinimonas sp. BJYL2]